MTTSSLAHLRDSTLRVALLGVVGAALSGAAHAQTWRAWSDARPLPAVEEVRSELDSLRAVSCGPGRSVADTLKETQAKLAALPADSPLRPAYETVIASLKEAVVKEQKAPSAPAQTGVLTLPAALNSARAWLNRNEPAGMKAFQVSPDSRDAKAAKAAALAASLAGRPNAAVAALLAAHTLNPRDGEVLVNLGGALGLLGLPREALAVLDAASAAGLPKVAALGWSPEAVALNNRGFALLQLGKAPEAVTALKRAVTLTPDLAEARANLGRALLCAGRTEEAVPLLRGSGRRTAQPTEPATPVTGAPPAPPVDVTAQDGPPGTQESTRPVEWVFDVSRGRAMNLPNLRLPRSPTEAVELHGGYVRLYRELTARQLRLAAAQDRLRQSIQAREGRDPTLVRQRRDALTTAVLRAHREPRVRPLWTVADRAGHDADVIWTNFWHCEGGCAIDRFITEAGRGEGYKERLRGLCIPALVKANDSWRSAMQLHATTVAKATEAEYRLQTGLAANSSDPQWHEWASIAAEYTAVSGMARLVAQAEAWSGDVVQFRDVCVQGAPSGKVEDVTVTIVAPRSSLCTGLLDKLSLSVSFKIVQISVSCDKASLKVATPGWIGAFGKIDKSFTKGDITVSVGAEAGVEIPMTSAGVKAAGGFYVTLDSEYDFKDVGMMAETKASLSSKVGPIKIGESVKGVSGRWSLIAGPST